MRKKKKKKERELRIFQLHSHMEKGERRRRRRSDPDGGREGGGLELSHYEGWRRRKTPIEFPEVPLAQGGGKRGKEEKEKESPIGSMFQTGRHFRATLAGPSTITKEEERGKRGRGRKIREHLNLR